MWAIGYWIVYPAWPTLNGYTKGYLGYSQRGAVDRQVADAKVAQSKYLAQIAAMPLDDIEKNQELMPFVIAGGAAVFGDNCSPCHGKGAQGGVGYPNLNDDDWLWGGSPAQIERTITYGIRERYTQRRKALPKEELNESSNVALRRTHTQVRWRRAVSRPMIASLIVIRGATRAERKGNC